MNSLKATMKTLRWVGLAILPAVMIQAQVAGQPSTAQNIPGGSGFGGGAPASPGDTFAIGLMNEEGENDLAAAAANYREAIRNFDQQREGAANAIFRLGEVYRKLGRFEEAKVQYARILREFPDMVRLTELSHSFLLGEDGLGAGGRAGFGVGGMGGTSGAGSAFGAGAGSSGGGFGSAGTAAGGGGMGDGGFGGGGGFGSGAGAGGMGGRYGGGSATGEGAGGASASADATTGLSPQMMQRYGLSPRSGGAGAMGADRDRVERGACVRNLQQLGLALRVYSSEHEGVFPSEVGAISDELGATRFLVCPADTEKNPAPSWQDFDPTVHMTYEFPGASGREDEPQAVIFRCPIHDNVALGDGSVQVGTGGTQTGVTPPMDEIMRRRYGLGSGTGDSMMRSDVRQEGESEMRQLYEEISALDSELGSVQQEQRKAQSEYAKLVMREVDAARTRQATSQERLEALSFPADRLPGIVNQDERYQKLKAGYETAVLDGDEAAQKRARARLEEWVDKIYRPELEAEVELADRQTAAVQARAQELSEQLQAFRAKEADTEKQLEAARLRLHQMEKRVETSSQR